MAAFDISHITGEEITMNESVRQVMVDDISYLWKNFSLFGSLRKIRINKPMVDCSGEYVSENIMRDAVLLCGKTEADRFAGGNLFYGNGEAIKMRRFEKGKGVYITDCGGTSAYLHDRFGHDVKSAAELFSRISCKKTIMFFGNEICIKTDKYNVLDAISEMLCIIYKAEKFGGINLCSDQKRKNCRS